MPSLRTSLSKFTNSNGKKARKSTKGLLPPQVIAPGGLCPVLENLDPIMGNGPKVDDDAVAYNAGGNGEMKRFYEAVLGEKNSTYYLAKFERFDEQGDGIRANTRPKNRNSRITMRIRNAAVIVLACLMASGTLAVPRKAYAFVRFCAYRELLALDDAEKKNSRKHTPAHCPRHQSSCAFHRFRQRSSTGAI